MLGERDSARMDVQRLTLDEVRARCGGAESAVGHPDTAAIFSRLLGREVEHARRHVVLAPGDAVIVGQYAGPRLPEGATSLPEGGRFSWFLVTVI